MVAKEVFPGTSVLSWYISAEQMLDDVLRVVPYCTSHENVWSPVLATVLLESCSQLDSLWNFEARQSSCVTKKKLEIPDYFCYFGEYLAYRWVVFWGEEPEQFCPYEPWRSVSQYTTANYIPLDWWQAYNRLKHDRLRNRQEATLKRALHALAALFLNILRCEFCRDEVAQAGWLSAAPGAAHNPRTHLGEDSPSTKDAYVLAESKLFSYPVGWCKQSIGSNDLWLGNGGHRFMLWFNEHRSR